MTSRTLLAVMVVLANVACGGGATGPSDVPPPPPPPTVTVDRVEVTATTATVLVGATTTLQATVRDVAGSALTGRAVTWGTSSATIATVSDGVVVGISAGIATISATSEGKTGTIQLTVNPLPALSCASTVPTGRLTRPNPGGSYLYTTQSGWKIELTPTWILTMTEPQAHSKVEWWGTPSGGLALSHENMNGKHIKDWLGSRRSMELPGNALITVQAGGTPATGHVSIYDGTESHRIDLPGFTVSRSCAIARFEEDLEHDGETSRVFDDGTGFVYDGIYQQGASGTGAPLQKAFQLIPFARTFFAQPNTTNDFYDDPRIGHTE